jgi:hypothetical protein
VINSDGNINFTTVRAGIGYTLPWTAWVVELYY